MIKNNLKWAWVLVFLLGLVFSSCLQTAENTTPVPQAEPRVTALPTIAHQAPTKTQTPTTTPKPATRTLELIPTIKPPTKTPYPTLSPEQASQLIDEAQKTNLGCELPCWWGITPGKTSWDAAQEFFGALNSGFEKKYRTKGYFVTVPYPNSQKIMLGLDIFLSDDDLVESMNVPPSYSMAELLEKFGEPKQVWFYSGGVSAYYMPPSFSIALFYPERGLLFYDQDEEGEYFRDGNTSIQICVKHLSVHSYPRFYLWNSDTPKTFEQIKSYLFDDPEDWRFRPLEEVTNLDIATFTREFSQPHSTTACFLSPADIWPFPLK